MATKARRLARALTNTQKWLATQPARDRCKAFGVQPKDRMKFFNRSSPGR